jgi:hypothetical protein
MPRLTWSCLGFRFIIWTPGGGRQSGICIQRRQNIKKGFLSLSEQRCLNLAESYRAWRWMSLRVEIGGGGIK